MILNDLLNLGINIKDLLITKVSSILPHINIENFSMSYSIAGMVVLIFGLCIAERKIKDLAERYPHHKGKLGWGVTAAGMAIIYFIAF